MSHSVNLRGASCINHVINFKRYLNIDSKITLIDILFNKISMQPQVSNISVHPK